MQQEEIKRTEEDEIDLVALFQTVWLGRKTIFKFILIFGLIGLFIAIFSPKQYTATTVMVPDFSKNKMGNNLGGLAAMAGIDIGGTNSSEVIPITIYPKIVESIPFKRELAKTLIDVSEVEKKVTFSEYYTEIYNQGVLAWLKKYTIGLPGVILRNLRGKQAAIRGAENNTIISLSEEDQQLQDILSNSIVIEVNTKEGYIQLSGSMPEALAAAELTMRAEELLQAYIIEFKSKKAVEKLKFVEERYQEKEKEFRKAELKLARFQDQNKNVISAQAATKEKRLEAEYRLSYNVYSELAKQIEQQKIKVKEDTPVFTIIEPVSVPVEKSKPKRVLILAIWLFLGVVIGVGVLFGKKFVRDYKKTT